MSRLLVGALLWFGMLASAQARVLVVQVLGGEEMFIRSAWLRQRLPHGVAGWLIHPAHYPDSAQRAWFPDLTLYDIANVPMRAGTAGWTSSPPPDTRAIRLVPDAEMAFGVRSTPESMPTAWHRDMRRAKWLDVVVGDVARALRYSEFCTPEQAERLQRRAWQQLDRWLASLAGMYDPQRDLVIVIGSSLEEGAPWAVWLYGKGVGKGWLWDGSVRVQGAGQTLSLLTTVCVALGKPVSPAWGDRLRGVGSPPSVKALIARRQAWLLRHPLWRGALWIRAAWIVLAGLGVLWAYRARREWAQHAVVRLRVVGQPSQPHRMGSAPTASRPPSTIRPSLFALFAPATWGVWGVALGVASLFPAALPAEVVWIAPLIVLLATGLLFWLARALDAPLVGLGAIAGLGLIALVLDTLSGGDWNRDGLFGHTLLGGYRFYGVGNQYSALALSWALILCTVWLRIEGLPLGALHFFALFALWMGWQSVNVGATLAVLGTLFMVGIPILREQLRGRSRKVQIVHGLILVGAAVLTLVLLWLNTPHLRAFWTGTTPILKGSDMSSMSDMSDSSEVVLRKVIMNLGESLLSPWAILLGFSLLAVGMVRPLTPTLAIPRVLQRAWLTAGMLCFLLNDLGVLMAAILAFHYWALTFTQIQQESLPPIPNRTHAMGGER